jgi:LAGLIDADG endonuclease
LQIILCQHSRDKLLLEKIEDILKSGNIYERKYNNTTVLTISNKLIPFFKKYKIKGIKYSDYEDFCKIAEIIKKENHVKLEGLEEIKLIKSKMNTKRILLKKEHKLMANLEASNFSFSVQPWVLLILTF